MEEKPIVKKKEYIYKYPQQCKAYPNDFIKDLNENSRSYEQIEQELSFLNITEGGVSFSRKKTLDKLAIIVPYRDREKNLKIFLHYMHLYLSVKDLTYQIFLIEPTEESIFNRGLLLNLGYLEALKEINFDCFVLHDVDMIPEKMDNSYICDQKFPTQMATSVSIYKYTEEAPNYFKYNYTGGVTSYTREQFQSINGYSNSFFGWGGEDDDALIRTISKFESINRLSPTTGIYFANCHEDDKAINHDRFNLLKNSKHMIEKDGLNSINYSVVRIIKNKLFTKVIVKYEKPMKK